jgi:uncharacterized protein YyaL (SSP411 family)
MVRARLSRLYNNFRSIAFRDRLGLTNSIASDQEHLKATIDWLKRAQDATEDQGVSAGFFEYTGWESSYPETTGYIIPTMFDYYHFAHDDDCRKRAIEMSNFLMNTQSGDGAFRWGFISRPHEPEVFDTGQCLQGLTRCYKETNKAQYLTCAIRAADWIISSQDPDGSWRKNSFHGIPHTYYTRVALALLELQEITKNLKYREAARKNAEWAAANSNSQGWYKNCAFDTASMAYPTTHVIGYTAEGILECGIMLEDSSLIQIATKTMNSLLRKLSTDGWIRGTYDENWETNDNYSCLTGDAQIALIWLRLSELTKDRRYFESALQLIDYVKATQFLHHANKGVEGGVKGSQPIYGEYNPNRFLNWAAKFFADSLLKAASMRGKY